jgi:hypothetical protein
MLHDDPTESTSLTTGGVGVESQGLGLLASWEGEITD